MTKRQIQKIHCRVRRGVNKLYRSYITSVLDDMRPHDRAGEVERALATVSGFHSQEAASADASRPVITPRDLKQRADLSSARLRERLWQVQHLRLDLRATGYP